MAGVGRGARALQSRERVRAMVLGDYDDDGQAREFVLLRGSARIESVETPCGDHGSDAERVLRVLADGKGLHATSPPSSGRKKVAEVPSSFVVT